MRQFDHRHHVLIVGMHTAVAQQTEQVQGAAGALGCRTGREQHLVAKEVAVFDRGPDAHQVLHHHAPGTEIQVSDFAVPHLSVGRAHSPPRCAEQRT